jgi:anaerobic magnesium-protoporphyrin IX monomethyl ester cyclase
VVICNSDASDHYKEYLKAGADFVIRGEGEETLEELLVTIKHEENPEKIKSIAYQSGNEILVNPSRSVIKDLDALPLPAWDLVDIEAYRKIWKKHHGYFSLNIATTRGCPYKCNWCAKPIYGNRYNARSPENVVAEIEMLLTLYKPDHFWMSDDIFGLKPGWVREFCDWVNRKKLVFRYKIQSRADLLLINDSLEALARSGAETVWIGAESGSQKILDAMDKGITVNQIKVATSLLKAQRIKVAYFLQFGYSGETVDDIQKTIDMVLENMPDEIGISVSYPLPGTQFYERVQSELKKKQNWVDSDDLDMMYPATYQPRFYKILHRYVHGRYRIQRGFNALRGFKLFDLKALASMIYYLPGSLINRIRLDKLSHRHVT